MITGVAIGYMLGTVVAFVMTILFGACCWVNEHEKQLAAIYDPETLDLNSENDDPPRTKTKKNE